MSSIVEEDDYILQWEKHHSAFVTFFSTLFKRSVLVDCTLAAEEKYIKAHKIVLMACSPYFEELLGDHCDNFPIVFLDIKFSALKSIIDFCYRGEVKVPYNDLEGFLHAAQILQIRGLTDSKSKSNEKSVGHSGRLKRRRSLVSDINSSKKIDNSGSESGGVCDEVVENSEREESNEGAEEGAPKKQKLTPEMIQSLVKCDLTSEETQDSDISDVDTDDDSESSIQGDPDMDLDVNELLLQATGSLMFPWSCNRCGEAFANRSVYKEHRKNCFAVPVDHPWKCEQCPSTYKNKKDLIRHMNYCGKEQPRLECDRCGKTYKYHRGLKRHQQYCGTDVKPLKCSDCDKTYKYKRGLRRHQRKCVIIRALNILQTQNKNITLSAPVKPPQETEQREKERKVGSLATLVCSCGKSYKYEKAFHKHRQHCNGIPENSSFVILKHENDE